MTTMTMQELVQAGYRVVDGRAVKVGSGEIEASASRGGPFGNRSNLSASERATVPLSPYRSKWEAERAEYHEMRKRGGLIRDWRYEAVRLKLADGAWYKADFLIQHNDGLLELEEVKGYWREAARVRFKVAVSQYPMFAFTVVSKEGGRWVEKESRVGGWLEIELPPDARGLRRGKQNRKSA